MSSSPSNLKLALDAYDAQQRRQAALIEAERIGNLIHIQEQQLLAAKHLAKQRKSQRRRHVSTSTPSASQPTLQDLSECAIEDEEEDVQIEQIVSAPAPMCPSLAARRAARSAAKRASLLPPTMPVLESIPEPEYEPQEGNSADARLEPSNNNNNRSISNITRWASHKRRPQEPFAALASRSQWKPDSLARFCDNVLCKKPFTLFGPASRHHCRRCGNVFCAACLSHTEVLYDMERSNWETIPEQLLASIFPPVPSPGPSPADYPKQEPERPAPTSPASSTSTNLSSSVESGSSRASTSSSSYFALQPSSSSVRQPITDPLHAVQREPVWRLGSNEVLPSPVPAEWRDQLLDIATEEKVCAECHDELWDQPTPVERYHARRAFNRDREEMAWALTVVGLEQWEEILRKHDLTLKPNERKEKKSRRGSSSTTTTTTTSSTQSRSSRHRAQPWSFPVQGSELPVGAPGVKPEEGLDLYDRPTYPHVYAWVTPPPCIRFTSSAFKPAPSAPTPSQSLPAPTPSPFGMLKSPAKFLPPPLPASYLAAHMPAPAHVPTGEEREALRQERYQLAVKDLVRAAYRRGMPCDHLDGGVMGVRYVVEPTPLQVWKTDLEKRALDLAARWRGDPVGC